MKSLFNRVTKLKCILLPALLCNVLYFHEAQADDVCDKWFNIANLMNEWLANEDSNWRLLQSARDAAADLYFDCVMDRIQSEEYEPDEHEWT